MITITFVSNDNKTVTAPPNSNLLRVSLREQGGIPWKCGGGICGTCRCHIDTGLEHTDAIKAKERKHLTEADFANGYRMACQTFVNGDISVSWQPRANSASLRKVESAEAGPAAPVEAAPPTPAADPQ